MRMHSRVYSFPKGRSNIKHISRPVLAGAGHYPHSARGETGIQRDTAIGPGFLKTTGRHVKILSVCIPVHC